MAVTAIRVKGGVQIVFTAGQGERVVNMGLKTAEKLGYALVRLAEQPLEEGK